MKKTLSSMVFIAFGAVLLSCSGFLEENPTSSLSETSVFSSEEALESQIYGIQSSFYGSHMMMGYMNEQLHTASGLLMWKGQRTQDDWIDGIKFAKYSDVNPNQQWYLQLYSAISCCNRLIDNLPGSPVDTDYKTEIEAEARFYRAVLYYYLVRLYGDVPLILSCPKTIAQTNQPRTSYYKVYASIVDDFNFAEEHMRDKARVDALTPGHGRPCRWAATAMKASVYMTIGSMLSSFEADPEDQFFDTSKDAALIAEGKDPRTPDFKAIGITKAQDAWTLCHETAQKVIEQGPYKLAKDYRQLFRWSKAEDFELDERIFCLQSTNQVSNDNRLALMSLPPFPEGSSNYVTKNGNSGRFRPSRFVFQKFAEANNGVKGTKSNNKNIYVSCSDPRFDATFFHTKYARTTGKDLKIYPDAGAILVKESSTSLPYFKKYLDPTWDVSAGNSDFYLMRFAEIYLIAAEAAARLSTTPGDNWWTIALDRVETIHLRARESVDDPSSPAPYPTWKNRTFADSQELLDAIFWERVFEMTGEGHEYFDTHRNGASWLSRVIAVPLNAFNRLPEQNSSQDGIFRYNYVGTPFPEAKADLRKSLLCGFPTTTEATYNTAIDPEKDQNDYFWR